MSAPTTATTTRVTGCSGFEGEATLRVVAGSPPWDARACGADAATAYQFLAGHLPEGTLRRIHVQMLEGIDKKITVGELLKRLKKAPAEEHQPT